MQNLSYENEFYLDEKKTRLDAEAQGNSEMADLKVREFIKGEDLSSTQFVSSKVNLIEMSPVKSINVTFDLTSYSPLV